MLGSNHSMNDNESEVNPVLQWIKYIDNYEVYKDDKNFGSFEIDPHELVKVLLNETTNREEKLYKGAFKEGEEIRVAREEFIKYLSGKMDFIEQKEPPRTTVKMEDLLDNKGVDLYLKALNEEKRSRAYRDAVFLKSINICEGPKWKNKLVMWVGGPSGCGKSYSTNHAIEKMSEIMEEGKKHEKEVGLGNLVVSVDGGIEREVSQMRQCVLQIALLKGYKGIEDLESPKMISTQDVKEVKESGDVKNSEIVEETNNLELPRVTSKQEAKGIEDIKNIEIAEDAEDTQEMGSKEDITVKDYIYDAVIAQEGLSVVIPETFATYFGTGFGKSLLNFKSKVPERLEKHATLRNTVHAFAEVVGGVDELTFKESVSHMGESRAWFKEDAKFSVEDFKPNNRKIGCESKKYEGKWFDRGTSGTGSAKKEFNKNFEGYNLEIKNDLIFVKEVEKGLWKKCGIGEVPDLKLTKHEFDLWREKFKDQDLKEWHKDQQKNVRKPDITIIKVVKTTEEKPKGLFGGFNFGRKKQEKVVNKPEKKPDQSKKEKDVDDKRPQPMTRMFDSVVEREDSKKKSLGSSSEKKTDQVLENPSAEKKADQDVGDSSAKKDAVEIHRKVNK